MKRMFTEKRIKELAGGSGIDLSKPYATATSNDSGVNFILNKPLPAGVYSLSYFDNYNNNNNAIIFISSSDISTNIACISVDESVTGGMIQYCRSENKLSFISIDGNETALTVAPSGNPVFKIYKLA